MVGKFSNYLKGFTLIELIVVIAIVSILVAIVLPSAFNAVFRARETEVIQMLSSGIRAQITYHYQYGHFANSWNSLDINKRNESDKWVYSAETLEDKQYVLLKAQPLAPNIRGYAAGLERVIKKTERSYPYQICKAQNKGITSFNEMIIQFKKRRVRCAENAKKA